MDKTYAFYIGGIKPVNIDSDAGVIRDVRLITEGSALGHNVDIDATTIDQILAACQSYQNGVKVKMDHGGGAGDIAGYVNNFRKASDSSGEYLLADLHLFANHPQRNYILELAKTIPDTFGLSCFFVGKPEVIDGRTKARCSRVFSCDIVTEPAANPSLFNIGPVLRSTEMSQVDKKKSHMDDTELKAKFEQWLKEREGGDKTQTTDDKPAAVVPTKEVHQVNEDGSEKHVITKGPTAKEQEDSENEMAARLSAKIMASFVKQGVRIAPSVSTAETTTQLAEKKETQVADKSFEDICLSLRTEGNETGKKLGIEEAVSYAIRNYPKAHFEYLQRCQAEGAAQVQHMQLSRSGSKDNSIYVPPFVSKVEHWKVQGTPKPGAMR